MRLYIIRHADPDYVHDTITEAGHKEARALAERLAREGIDEIYSSPLGRARATAAYTADRVGLPVEVLTWTQEISDAAVEIDGYGRMAAWDTPGELIFDRPLELEEDGWLEIEQTREVRLKRHYDHIARSADEFLEKRGYRRSGQMYEAVAPTEARLALFCHGGFGLALLSHLLRIPPVYLWTGLWLPPSSVTTVLFEMRSERWALPRCLAIAEMSHLYESRLPLSFSGLLGNHF